MTSNDRSRGVVLVAVLWSIALLSALAMAASTTFRGFAGIMAVDRNRVQAEALLSAGVETAAGIVAAAGDGPLMDVETELRMAAGSVRVRASDEGGRIDIGKAPLEVLAALFNVVGASDPNGLAAEVERWRNPPRDAFATTLTAAARPREGTDWQLTDVRQLANVPGMSPEWVDAVAPMTTVFGNETVNPLTAPARVIAALPGISETALAAFLEQRRRTPTDGDRLAQFLGPANRYVAVKPTRMVSVEVATRLAGGYGAAARATIVIVPQDTQPYRVLTWNPLRSP
ncbi:MAG: hypothetical protein ACLPKB_31680 [Xanthobacteraceae bacterium]